MLNTLISERAGRAARQVALLVGVAAAVGCNSTTEPGGDVPTAITALPRALTATEVKVRDAANDFSFALLGTLADSQAAENTFISPLSAGFSLGMTMNGANGITFEEMQSAMQLRGLTQPEINAGYKSLIDLLVSLDPSVQMKIANSIWYRNTFAFHQTFFDTTKKYFNAEVKGLNFADGTGSLNTINSWVSTATNDKIKKVLDNIAPNDVMFLINAIYFKGSWRDKFDAAKTTPASFTSSTGATQTVSLMNRLDDMSYAETPTYQAIDLPYGNSAFSMTVLLPKAGLDVNVVAKSLNTAAWATLTAALHTQQVNLALPKLKLEYERTLTGDLIALGMRNPFTDAADFSKMTGSRVFISFVKQNSFVDINEEGTEAAAVTVTGVQVTSVPVAVTMRVNRPYIFVLRERLSGTVLFMGKIVRMPAS